NLRLHHFETPSPHTEFGAKGMGEGGAIAPPAVLFGAVNDALARIGAAELSHTPLTPMRVLSAIAAGAKEAAGKPPASLMCAPRRWRRRSACCARKIGRASCRERV